ncbi:hypothetical protein DSECCO2_617940 [anaerobic digester metagenome]
MFTPLIVTLALAALKFSYSISPSSPPSTVYAKSAPNPFTSNMSAPLPTSSSGVKAIFIVPCSTSGLFTKYSAMDNISAIPALLSAPRSVVPSVTIRSFPT